MKRIAYKMVWMISVLVMLLINNSVSSAQLLEETTAYTESDQNSTDTQQQNTDKILQKLLFESECNGIKMDEAQIIEFKQIPRRISTSIYRASSTSYRTPLGHFNNVVNFSNGISSNTYVDFLGEEYQCVEYINRYYYEIYGYDSWKGKGDAKDYINLPNSVSDLSKYDNGGITKPQAGDILVFDGISTDEKLKYGHVSIIREVGNDYVKLIHQNVNQNKDDSNDKYTMQVIDGKYTILKKKSLSILGWVRTSKTKKEVYIVDDDNSINKIVFSNGSASGGKISSAKGRIYDNYSETNKGKGYLNGLRYAKSIQNSSDTSNYVLAGFYIKAPKSMIVDIYAFIPDSHTTSKKVTYYLYKDSISSSNQFSNVTIDQSSFKDEWASLFFSVSFVKDTKYYVVASNNTGEESTEISYDALKIVVR